MKTKTQFTFELSQRNVEAAIRDWLANNHNTAARSSSLSFEFGQGGETYDCTVTMTEGAKGP